MSIDPLEWEADVTSSNLRLVRDFYNKEPLPIFLEEITDRKAGDYKKVVESKFRQRAVAEGWSHGIDEAELQEYLDGCVQGFYSDRQVLRRALLASVAVHITRLVEHFLVQATPFFCRGVKIPQTIEDAWDLYKKVKMPVQQLNGYKDVCIARLISNVYKHGEGRSKEKLKGISPRFFEQDSFGEETLSVDFLRVRMSDLFDGAEQFLSGFVLARRKFQK